MARNTKVDAEKTRQLILDAALDTFFEKGYSRSPLTDISTRVGLTKGALYWHFTSKVDLFSALVEGIQKEVDVKINLPFRESENMADLKKTTLQFATILIEDEKIFKYYSILYTKMEWQDELEPVMQFFSQQDAHLRRRITDIMIKEQDLGTVHRRHSPESIAISWLAMIGGFLFRILKQKDSPKDVLTSLNNSVELIVNALKS